MVLLEEITDKVHDAFFVDLFVRVSNQARAALGLSGRRVATVAGAALSSARWLWPGSATVPDDSRCPAPCPPWVWPGGLSGPCQCFNSTMFLPSHALAGRHQDVRGLWLLSV